MRTRKNKLFMDHYTLIRVITSSADTSSWRPRMRRNGVAQCSAILFHFRPAMRTEASVARGVSVSAVAFFSAPLRSSPLQWTLALRKTSFLATPILAKKVFFVHYICCSCFIVIMFVVPRHNYCEVRHGRPRDSSGSKRSQSEPIFGRTAESAIRGARKVRFTRYTRLSPRFTFVFYM